MRIILLLAALTLNVACSNSVKEKLGLATSGPNEYTVQRNKGLEVPPHYDLPPPGEQHQPSMGVSSGKTLTEDERALMEDIESAKIKKE